MYMKNKTDIWYHLLAIAIVSIWGTTYISTSILLHGGTDTSEKGLSPLQIYTLRSIIAYIGLLIACHRQLLSKSWRDELTFLLLGLTGGTIYYLCENTAVKLTHPANVSLIVSAVPIATMFLSAAMGRIRLNIKIIGGSLIAFTGIACVIFADGQKWSSGMIAFLGDLLALAAVMSWAVYSVIISKMFSRYTTLFITRKVFFYGMCSVLIVISMSNDKILPLDILSRPIVLSNLFYLGIVASLICFWTFNIAMRHIGVVATNNYGYLTPIVTFVFAILVLNDNFTWLGATGIIITLSGLYLAQTHNSDSV